MNNLLKQHNEEMEKEFGKEYVATGADIEGMKRVEYRHLRENQVDTIISFILSQNKALLKKIALAEIERLEGEQYVDPNQQMSTYNEAIADQITHWQSVLKELE